ncbi:deoxyribonuclease-1 [Synchiropus picturatus]
MRRVGSLLWSLALLHLASSLLLGAFNVKSFGDKKASNATIMGLLSQIIQRYDIVLIQEVRDKDLSATTKLMEHVNKNAAFTYRHIVSEPLGRSSYKERYLFVYREATVSVLDSFTYDDGCEACGTDTFIREPFVVKFSSVYSALQSFVLVPQHTSPDFALEETDALYDVVADVRARWDTDLLILLGDFNTDCNYVSGVEWQKIRLFTDKSFHWLIGDDVDTTVTHTHCAYDRIVVSDEMKKGVQPGSAGIYDFMTDLNLSLELALAVSDHFPVDVKLLRSTARV